MLDVRYAPTPKLIFSLKVSFLKASVIPRIASGGPCLTLLQVESVATRDGAVGHERCRAKCLAADRNGDSIVRARILLDCKNDDRWTRVIIPYGWR